MSDVLETYGRENRYQEFILDDSVGLGLMTSLNRNDRYVGKKDEDDPVKRFVEIVPGTSFSSGRSTQFENIFYAIDNELTRIRNI